MLSPRGRSAILLLALAAIPLTSCGGDGSADGGRAAPGFVHVHAVGADPADGAVYVASHRGLFRLGEGNDARLVGPDQDTMGFTGSGTFLASGHPSEEAQAIGAEPHLGLIRSTDAGSTWTTVSEAGKADFHALQQAGESLYAYDSQTGRVRRSTDGGRTWRIGARLPVFDLAAGEKEPDRVYATTEQGVMLSQDGGASFAPLAGAPLLLSLDVTPKGGLIGTTPDGRVHAGPDWKALGQVSGGAIAAFTVLHRPTS
ncbi:F510_1955 family glycosylhydrolase [Actinocorallia libanotica]|uniref:Exo-alpha-sialidase n=1 Tax=Actinocorallia libanotica TaxID=46162 RepID=A0ABP4CKH7_9ACTN